MNRWGKARGREIRLAKCSDQLLHIRKSCLSILHNRQAELTQHLWELKKWPDYSKKLISETTPCISRSSLCKTVLICNGPFLKGTCPSSRREVKNPYPLVKYIH